MFPTRTEGIVVPARSKADIAGLAGALRRVFRLSEEPYFPVVEIYDYLDLIIEGASYEILTAEEMGDDHGRTYPEKNLIHIREDVFDGAYDKKPRDRFTLCHELGHLLMHRGVALSRVNPMAPPKIYRNSEWQADTFASHLMMPKALLAKYSDVGAVTADFCVSYEAANARREDMEK